MRFLFGLSIFLYFISSLLMGVSSSHPSSTIPKARPFSPSFFPSILSSTLSKNQNTNEILIYSTTGIHRINSITNSTTGVLLNIPPRRMWGWGNGLDGYCGETSIQSVGIYYGNYISQEEVRYSDGNSELLIAVNDEKAASALKYKYTEWDYNKNTPQQSSFTTYVINQLNNGIPVIAGWYEKQPSGDADYDHIMPIIGYEASSDGTLQGFYHNDFYLNEVSLTTTSDPLFATRNQCKISSTPKQPYDYCLPKDVDYGLTITGIVDSSSETYRTLLEVSSWSEPDWGAEDKLHEQPILISVKAHISGLTIGKSYAILRFDDVKSIPTKNLLSGSYAKKYQFTATATEMIYEGLDQIMSDSTSFFRTVLA